MRKLVLDPDPRLRKVCARVEKIDSYVRALAKEMLNYVQVYTHMVGEQELKSLGLAAPQFGELLQLFVISTPALSITAINPRLTKTAGSRKLYEACLSLPGRMFVVERPKLVKFKGLTLGGEERTWKVHDQLAQVVMHEMEHLRGILVVDVAITEVKDF